MSVSPNPCSSNCEHTHRRAEYGKEKSKMQYWKLLTIAYHRDDIRSYAAENSDALHLFWIGNGAKDCVASRIANLVSVAFLIHRYLWSVFRSFNIAAMFLKAAGISSLIRFMGQTICERSCEGRLWCEKSYLRRSLFHCILELFLLH